MRRVLILGVVIAGCSQAPPPQPVIEPTKPVVAAVKKAEPEVAPAPSELDGFAPEDLFEVADAAPNFVLAGKSDQPHSVGAELFSTESRPIDSASGVVLESSSQRTAARALPRGFIAIDSETIEGWPRRVRSEVDQSELVLVPTGECSLGSTAGPAQTQPAVRLVLDAFYIGVHEIRLGQYLEAKQRMAARGTVQGEPLNAGGPPQHPVLGVAWIDAKNYAASIGAELPTEAQWEKAARGPQGFTRPWGESRPLWTQPRDINQIDPVGQHLEDRSVYGVLDMAGNAWEWTADLYQPDVFAALNQLPQDRRRNWAGPRTTQGASQRVVKGGGQNWEVYERRGVRLSDRLPQLGFRVVLNLTGR